MTITYGYLPRTGSARTYQAPVYDPDGTGDDAYGRYPLTAIMAALILKALDTHYPGYTITLAAIPGAETVTQITGNGLEDFNIMYADTSE